MAFVLKCFRIYVYLLLTLAAFGFLAGIAIGISE